MTEVIFFACKKQNLSPKLRKIKALGYKIKHITGPNIENTMFITVYPERERQLKMEL